MTFARLELLWLLLAAPIAATVATWLWRRRLAALSAWASQRLWPRLDLLYRTRHRLLSIAGLTLAVLAAAAALSEPRWGTLEEKVEREGVDVVFILDSSLSMAADDARPDRITVAKNMVRELTHRLPGHRVALVQAEGEGVVLAPLTVDGAVIDLLLDTVLPASLPTPGTLLKAAVERAIALFPADSQKHRAIVLISDGEDHSEGREAIETMLEESGAVIYAIGVGSLPGAPIRMPGSDGYKQDKEGRVVVSKLNEALLEHLARETDGVYLRASGLGIDVEPILNGINGMERRSLDGQILNVLAQRFQWPLALAVLALVLHLMALPLAPARSST